MALLKTQGIMRHAMFNGNKNETRNKHTTYKMTYNIHT